ncbi:cytochrome P450 [Mycena maculata]|uniref:Cytochrome P450 n=1 Tax=Mycena maculata TaxID=230809 RepID=A0AAD7K0J7_9AGAR|nr:cytochrome P450 [Mycena maculata]
MDSQDRLILLASLWIVYTFALLLLVWAARTATRTLRRVLYTTTLRGPEQSSGEAMDIAVLAARYGPAFQVPTGLFSREIVLCDATAIAHFYANAPLIYRTPDFVREATKNLAGRGLTWADGERHSGHRQALAPLFTEASVEQNFAPTFFAMAHKMESMWTRALESRRGMVIDIQNCLDSLGVAGFSHDFESLSGGYCLATAALYTLRAPRTRSLSDALFRLAALAPSLRALPTAKNRIINDFLAAMSRIAGDVLERSAGKSGSVLGLLIKSLAEHPAGEFRLSHAEVLAQMVLKPPLWVLVELAKNPSFQDKLRIELVQVNDLADYSQISKLPYLHAVVYETLRLHSPIGDTTRVAAEDDVIPLSSPIAANSGETITSIKVAKGTVVTVPIRYVNTSETFWGPGFPQFDPGRWWQDRNNVDFPGNRHLAFGDGPRTCLGAEFSLALVKVVLAVIVGGFTLSLPEGPQTVVESTGGHISQPKMPGRGSEMLMVVARVRQE